MPQPTRRTILKTAVAAAGAGMLSSLSFPTFAQEHVNESDLVLWYRKPAEKWVEALPIGNGRIGGMIHGTVDEERVELNDNTLYSGEPGLRDLPKLNVTKDFDKVTGWLSEGKYAEAVDFVNKNWLGR